MRTRTVRRDKLKRDIQKGLYVCKCNHRYTDDYAYDYASNYGETDFMEVKVQDHNGREHGKGILYLHPEDFSGYGNAWENEDGTVTLWIHSNLSYDLKKVGA
jgi:hypothetical protein